MISVQNVVSGPSRWDLMISLFNGKPVTFTLDSRLVINGQAKTLHDHHHEDTIIEDESFVYALENFHDWLILIEPSAGEDFYYAAIEYHEKSRTGGGIVLTKTEHEALREKVSVDEIYSMPAIWLGLVDTLQRISLFLFLFIERCRRSRSHHHNGHPPGRCHRRAQRRRRTGHQSRRRWP